MKSAVLCTTANVEMAYQLVKDLGREEESIFLYQQGKRWLKLCAEKSGASQEISISQEIAQSNYSRIIVVELPHSSVSILPNLAWIALKSKAGKCVMLKTGKCIPFTLNVLLKSIIKSAVPIVSTLLVLPVVLLNITVLLVISSVTDLLMILNPNKRIKKHGL